MAPGCGDASMATCLHRTGDDDLSKVLAELQASGSSTHFHKTLARRSRHLRFSQGAKLCLPVWFVKEHGDKLDDWVNLRTLSPAKLWRVRLRVAKIRPEAPEICFTRGWRRFFLDNGLKEGDSLMFALNVDARSEFRVYIFRLQHQVSSGRQGVAGISPAERTNVPKAEEGQQILPGGSSPQGLEYEHAQLPKEITPSQRRGVASSFRRRLVAYRNKWAQSTMEVPARFVKAHGMPGQLKDVVKLQGVHQESIVRTVTCRWYEQGGAKTPRLFLKDGWDAFAKENGLRAGQELNFTLASDSFFIVRVVI